MPQTPDRKRTYMRDYMRDYQRRKRGYLGGSKGGLSPEVVDVKSPLLRSTLSPSKLSKAERHMVEYLEYIGKAGYGLEVFARPQGVPAYRLRALNEQQEAS